MRPALPPPKPPSQPAPAHSLDLQSQLEELLGAVWQAEANWRFDDRLDVAVKLSPPAARRRRR